MMSCAGPAACNLHTAIALVSKMRAMGIEASCKQLVMQPSVALKRRKQQQSRQQVWECHSAAPPQAALSSVSGPSHSRAGSLECHLIMEQLWLSDWDKSVFMDYNALPAARPYCAFEPPWLFHSRMQLCSHSVAVLRCGLLWTPDSCQLCHSVHRTAIDSCEGCRGVSPSVPKTLPDCFLVHCRLPSQHGPPVRRGAWRGDPEAASVGGTTCRLAQPASRHPAAGCSASAGRGRARDGLRLRLLARCAESRHP